MYVPLILGNSLITYHSSSRSSSRAEAQQCLSMDGAGAPGLAKATPRGMDVKSGPLAFESDPSKGS